MGNQWFRLYAEFAHDPKVQMMSEQYQRRFVMLLCLCCGNVTETFQDEQVAFQLRISSEEWAETKSVFMAKNLITDNNKPIAWEKRQYLSDTSTERVRRHREQVKQQCNVSVTAPEADTEADTDIKDIVEQDTRQRVRIPFTDIVSFLNEKAGTEFKPETAATRKHVKARWAEGFRLEDFLTVVEHKVGEWKTDPKMCEFLRPQTLFGTKFESYLQSAKHNHNDGF